MGYPRSVYFLDGSEGVYHCFNRCVRGAFLCGFDKKSGRDYSHRKKWVVNRLRYLASVFAVEVLAYAIMESHFHNIIRTRPDIAETWSAWEVATRWLKLSRRYVDREGNQMPPPEKDICALAACPDRIEKLRKRLSSLSWFMGQLNEYIARAANREDGVKGRFWESRFKCQVLLDGAAITACMVYVDLNLVRAGLAKSPEESQFTSIQARIRSWQQKQRMRMNAGVEDFISQEDAAGVQSLDSWLCPIQSSPRRHGILQMSEEEYFDLVDRSGRLVYPGKSGVIDNALIPILLRIRILPDHWRETIARFGSKFCIAAGLNSSLRKFADRLGRRWVKGVSSAKFAFAS